MSDKRSLSRGRTKSGYFWAIARDDRPWLGPEPPGVAYTYAPGRGAIHALRLLEGYTGVVQCDGYSAYKTLVDPAKARNCAGRITLAFCWSHLRRRFVELERRGSTPTAKEALRRIAQLYVIERSLRGRPADERRAGRQAHSKPLVLALKAWFDEQLAILSGKSLTAEAIRYGLILALGIFAQGGIAEEVVFRGFLFRRFRRGRSFWRATSLAAIPFVAVHALLFLSLDFPIALSSLLLALSISFPLAWLFEISGGSIWPSAIIHAVIQGTIKLVDAGEALPALAIGWIGLGATVPWALFLLRHDEKRPEYAQ